MYEAFALYDCRSIVPEICVETPIIDYGRCFIRYPYEKMVVLKNETDLPAKYELLPQVGWFFNL